MELGDCFVEQGNRTIFCLVTKLKASNPPSIDHFESALRKLVDECAQLKIQKLAFAKYQQGCDKLNWQEIEELLNRSFAHTTCSVYLNKPKTSMENDDLDVSAKIKKLQRVDMTTCKPIERVKNNSIKGFIMEDDIFFKSRISKHRKIFKQLVVPET